MTKKREKPIRPYVSEENIALLNLDSQNYNMVMTLISNNAKQDQLKGQADFAVACLDETKKVIRKWFERGLYLHNEKAKIIKQQSDDSISAIDNLATELKKK